MMPTMHLALRNKALIRTILLSTTILAGSEAAASKPDLETRVEALELKLDQILNRLDNQPSALTTEEKAVLEDAAALLATDRQPQPVTLEAQTPGGVSAQNAIAAAPTPTPAPTRKNLGFSVGDTDFTFKGFVKLDASITDFDGGELPTNSLGRDFYIPGLVPVGGEGDGPDFDFSPRETRFQFAVNTQRGGHDIGGVIEFDFQVTNDGNERVSNSFAPRMRHAYITVDNWLFGQTWSTFQDVSALPDNLDFIGPTEGTVFIRQPMVRYTKGPWQIALEQPETEITSPTGGRLLPGDDVAPDVVVRYNHKRKWGHLTLAAIGRAIHAEDNVVPGAVSDTAIGYGVSASGKLKVGARDDFRFMATYGEGIGRYVGVNIVNDAAIDLAGELETIQTISGFASYRHFWTPKLRTNLTGGYFKADNPIDLVGDGVTDQVYSSHVNLIYTPITKFDVGVEYIYANRELESGVDGNMHRVQFSTKYSF